MKRFTLILSLLVAMVTTAMAQKAHQRVSHDGWTVTALNEAVVSGNEGGVAFIADDNAATFYHSNWSSNYTDGNGMNKGKDGLQAFMVELPTSLSDLSLITYKGRPDNNTSGWARGVRVYVFETLPTGWPEGGLSSLGYVDKQALLASTNTNLGTAAFDNTAKLWANDRTQKLVEFATPQTGKYVLFIMESGSDLWLTCSDFQIYQLKDYAAIEAETPYFLQVTNAAATGTQYVDIKTPLTSTSANTIGISTTTVETYFEWNTDANAWNIKDDAGTYLAISKCDANPGQATPGNWQLFVNDDNTLSIFQGDYDGASDNSRCFLGGDVTTSTTETKLYTDNAKDKAINVTLIDASAVPVTVKYSFTWNGVEKGIQTTETIGGELYPDVDFELPFGVAATKPDGEIDAKEAVDGVITKTIVLENTLPFAFADSYENINKWYYIQMHSSGGAYSRFLQYAETYIEWADVTRTISENALYTWGFIGDPFTGFKLVNYGAPADANAVVSAKDSGNPSFGTIADAVAWNIKASRTNADSEHFCFQYPGSNQYMNAQDGKVAFWGDNDQGSTLWVTERDMTGATELQELVDGVDAVSASYQGAIGTAVGNLTEESVTAVANALTAAKSTLALDGKTPVQIADAHMALQTAIDNLVTVQPTEGKFYTIASACAGGREGKMIYVNADGGMKFDVADNTNLGYLFQFEAAGEGQFYMYNVAKDRYLSTAKAHGYGQEESLAEETTGAKKVTIKNLGRENVVGLWPEGGAMIHAQDANSVVVAWNNEENNNGSAWRIVEVEDPTTTSFHLTIGEAGYATLYLGCAVTVPAAVKAFPVTVDGEWAVFGDALTTIPANTGVIIAGETGEAAAAGTYKFNYTAPVAAIEGNQLHGSTIDSYKEGPAYVLGYINVAEEGEEERNEVGFYTATLNRDENGNATGTTHFKNNANKAYLVVPGASEVAYYSFRFGEGTTGIEKVEIRNEKSEIYDLTGRRVETITAPGIYIVGGKKVLVK